MWTRISWIDPYFDIGVALTSLGLNVKSWVIPRTFEGDALCPKEESKRVSDGLELVQ